MVFHLCQAPQRINLKWPWTCASWNCRHRGGPGGHRHVLAGAPGAPLLDHRAGFGAARLGQLGYEWRQDVRENADVRLWKGGLRCRTGGRLPHHRRHHHGARPVEWTPAAEVVGSVMGAIEEPARQRLVRRSGAAAER
ncbi:hypothetical protein ACTMU2_35070 [Cupriavidus basilensis]